MPPLAVSQRPDLRVPEIVGVFGLSVPFTTAAVAAEAREVVMYPARVPVTCTVMVLPTSAGCGW